MVALFDELRRAGFVEGRNLVVAAGGYGLRTDEFSRHASVIANSDIDVVYAGGDTAIRAAQAAIRTIPSSPLPMTWWERGSCARSPVLAATQPVSACSQPT